MLFMPFILDRSLNAKLIKSINASDRSLDALVKLKNIMTHDIKVLPYGYLEQAFRRAEAALPLARSEQEQELLNSIQMMALHRIQRIHMESRP